jgi:transposase InsO family protein
MARPHDCHAAAELAAAYCISASWVRTQRRRAERCEAPCGPGRPRIPDSERARVSELVHAELDRQGWRTGHRTILEALRREEKELSETLVREATAALKKEVRSRVAREIEERREGHEVCAKDAVWAEDATHLGRLADASEVSGEVITDRGTLSTVSLSVGPPPDALAVVEDLGRAALLRGGWPLVLQHDRASIYGAGVVRERLARERTIALVSRVHTPTDNPVAERQNRELKEESGLGKGVVLEGDEAAAALLEPAVGRLQVRLRATRGYRSPDELDREWPRADAIVDRALFHEEACSAMREAVLGLTEAEEIQKAEQDAVWRTLEKHGLARLHVGPRRSPRKNRPSVAPATAG